MPTNVFSAIAVIETSPVSCLSCVSSTGCSHLKSHWQKPSCGCGMEPRSNLYVSLSLFPVVLLPDNIPRSPRLLRVPGCLGDKRNLIAVGTTALVLAFVPSLCGDDKVCEGATEWTFPRTCSLRASSAVLEYFFLNSDHAMRPKVQSMVT
jgi:hypothetical protein